MCFQSFQLLFLPQDLLPGVTGLPPLQHQPPGRGQGVRLEVMQHLRRLLPHQKHSGLAQDSGDTCRFPD